MTQAEIYKNRLFFGTIWRHQKVLLKLTDLDWADVFSSLLALLDFPISEGKDSTCHDVSYACSNEAEIKVKTWINGYCNIII